MADEPQPTPQVALGDDVAVVDTDGRPATVPRSRLKDALDAGFRLQSPDEYAEHYNQATYGDSPVTTALESAARTASFGLSDAILTDKRLFGVDPEAMRQREARNTGANLVGGIAGAFLPGAGTIAGAAGGAAREAFGGASALARVAGGVAEGATGGAVFGAGQGVSNVALSDHPMTPEAIAEELGTSILGGAGAGAAGGLFLSAIGEAARGVQAASERMAARAAVDGEAAATAATEGPAAAEGTLAPSKLPLDDAERARIGSLDRDGVKAEIEQETAGIKAQRAGEGQTIADDVSKFREDARLMGVQVADALPKGVGYAREFIKADKAIENVTGNMKGLAQNPGKALDPLQRYEQALQQAIPRIDNPDLVAQMNANIERVQKLQERVQAVTAPLESPKLTALTDRLDAIKETGGAIKETGGLSGVVESKTKSAVRAAAATALHGVMGMIPGGAFVAHMLGDVIGDKAAGLIKGLAGRVEGATAGHMEKIAQGASAALRGTAAAADRGGFVAAKVLNSVRFADTGAATKYKQSAADIFKQRAGELAQAVAQPEQTQKAIAQRLQGLGLASPLLAVKVAQTMTQKLQYLYQQMPKRMPIGTPTDSFDKWQPTAAAIHGFAKVVDVVLHPTKLLDDLKSGRITQATVAAVRATNPETFSAMQQALWSKVTEIRKELPYSKQLGLSLMFDKPFATSMRPEFIAASQSHFAPQSSGPQPTMGSPPKSSASLSKLPVTTPTASQKLSS